MSDEVVPLSRRCRWAPGSSPGSQTILPWGLFTVEEDAGLVDVGHVDGPTRNESREQGPTLFPVRIFGISKNF